MASPLVKKVAGLYIEDTLDKLPPVLYWASKQCRSGFLFRKIKKFCKNYPEITDLSLIEVEKITEDFLYCKIRCRCYDYESSNPFTFDFHFKINPKTGECFQIY